VGGPYASYTQSERTAFYADALQTLTRAGLLYPCYCSRADLARIAGAPHGPADDGPRYPGLCRGLTPAQQAERAAKKPTPSLRFVAPAGEICLCDEIAGPLCQDVAASVGDFVVRRADGMYAYQLAVVVDDAAMGITHVLRGDDLLHSTPRQIALCRALGLPVPTYAHVPLLVGPDGNRLAKRHGDTSLAGLRSTGVAPQTVVGWLAYWSGLLDKPEPVEPADLIAGFDLGRVPRTPVVVDRLPTP
jgi:glutamyl-tRNA synthetase